MIDHVTTKTFSKGKKAYSYIICMKKITREKLNKRIFLNPTINGEMYSKRHQKFRWELHESPDFSRVKCHILLLHQIYSWNSISVWVIDSLLLSGLPMKTQGKKLSHPSSVSKICFA